MTYLFRRSEFKYFVIETGDDYTIILPNSDTYDARIDNSIDPYLLTPYDDKRIKAYIGKKLKKPIQQYGRKDGAIVVEAIHLAIYQVLSHEIKQWVIARYGNPEMVVGI